MVQAPYLIQHLIFDNLTSDELFHDIERVGEAVEKFASR